MNYLEILLFVFLYFTVCWDPKSAILLTVYNRDILHREGTRDPRVPDQNLAKCPIEKKNTGPSVTPQTLRSWYNWGPVQMHFQFWCAVRKFVGFIYFECRVYGGCLRINTIFLKKDTFVKNWIFKITTAWGPLSLIDIAHKKFIMLIQAWIRQTTKK